MRLLSFEKLKTSSRVPIGHSQPHQARPTTRLERSITNESSEPLKKNLLLNKFESIASGLRCTRLFVSLGGKALSLLKTSVNTNTASEIACRIFLAICQLRGIFFRDFRLTRFDSDTDLFYF